MSVLNVGLSSWIIQDGNYRDFSVNQEARFALEFHSESISPSGCRAAGAIHRNASRYQVCGKVIYSTEETWVLDAGFLAYQDSPPPSFARMNSWVEVTI